MCNLESSLIVSPRKRAVCGERSGLTLPRVQHLHLQRGKFTNPRVQTSHTSLLFFSGITFEPEQGDILCVTKVVVREGSRRAGEQKCHARAWR